MGTHGRKLLNYWCGPNGIWGYNGQIQDSSNTETTLQLLKLGNSTISHTS